MARDKENQRRIAREWYLRNKELVKQRAKEWDAANYERKLEIKAKYREKNREQHNEYNREYKQQNKDKYAALQAKRRAAQLQRTPKWLDEDDFWWMEEIYHLAILRTEMLGVQHHVDHIIPLQGQNVCGLHVPSNLQVIPARENLKKSNRHPI